MTVPWPAASFATTAVEVGTVAPVTESTPVPPWVLPLIRLSAPGVEGPKPVSQALSLIA